jgi:hypothetical protein|tara:strand:- start:45 stop:209 length:165 start_codon:yes stop_codon:yes gene_type:complete
MIEYLDQRQWLKTGITFGTALAIAISFSMNKSVFWAIIHGLFSWLYVIYYILLY